MARYPWEPDPVLVGVDGSQQSIRAVRWAAREAVRRDVALTVVHTWVWPLMHVPLGGSPLAPPGAGLQAQADRILAQASDTARSMFPDLVVQPELVVGDPATELLRRAEGSQLVVVGNRGLGGFTGLLIGSTGIALSARSPRPVTVVRGTATPGGPVVVGLGESGASDAVLRRAIHEADLHGTGVLVVHSWTVGADLAGTATREVERAERLAEERAAEHVEKSVARARQDGLDVPVSVRLGGGSAAAELVGASRDAELVVVGSHDLGPLRGLLMGSTTHALIHHAACPVLIDR